MSIKIRKAIMPNRSFVQLIKVGPLFMLYFFLGHHLIAQEKVTKPGIFYAVTGNGLKDTSWLFGTHHLVNNSYLEKIPSAQKAFNKTTGLVVEIVIDSSKLAAAQAMGLLKDKTLTSLLDKPFSDSLEAELKQTIGVGLDQLNQLKPMNVTLVLSIMYLMKNNGALLKQYTGLPLDVYFVEQAKQMGKPIHPLETVEGQMDLLFNKTSDVEQAEQLKAFIRNKKEIVELGDALVTSWFNHDLDNMYLIYDKTLRLSNESDYLIKNRNIEWMKSLPQLLRKEPQFIAVGALHLAGPNGLVKQLEQLGYTITPIN